MSLLLSRIGELGARFPEAQAISFLDEQGCVVESLSRADVVAEMAGVADFLRRGCGLVAGDRVLLVFPPGLDFVRGLVGCMAVGVVPVPVYPPDPMNPQRSMEHVRRVAADCGASVVLTNRTYADARELGVTRSRAAEGAVEWPAGLSWHVIPAPGQGSTSEGMSGWSPGADTPALLQYTSGSTADPKGVVITYGNLAHQFEFEARYLGLGLDARGVFWVPAYHDFGLISAILNTLAGNFELTLMSPLSFLQRPAVWFEVMHRVRATHTVAPNFGFELAVRKTTPQQRAGWDLSSLEMVMSAAEPVREATTRRFLEAFRVSGLRPEAFCPAYGLAEHTVGVTLWGRDSVRVDRGQLETQQRAVVTEDPDAAVVMGCGALSDDVDVRIVDPDTCTPLDGGQVGEIWVDSPSKAAGYWGKPEASLATFHAQLGRVRRWPWLSAYWRFRFPARRRVVCVWPGQRPPHRRGPQYLPRRRRRQCARMPPSDQGRRHRGVLHRRGHLRSASGARRGGRRRYTASVVQRGRRDTGGSAAQSPVALRSRGRGPTGWGEQNHQRQNPTRPLPRSPTRRQPQHHALLIDRGLDEPPVEVTPIARSASRSAAELQATVREQVAAVLGIGVADVYTRQPLGEQGLNSIGVTDLALRLSQLLVCDVQPVDVFNHPTVEGLAQMLSRGEAPGYGQRRRTPWGALCGDRCRRRGCRGRGTTDRAGRRGGGDV